MVTTYTLNDSEVKQALADYVSRKTGSKCTPDGVSMSHDAGGGPLDRGSGYTARVNGQSGDVGHGKAVYDQP
jgi:hypothetical protein